MKRRMLLAMVLVGLAGFLTACDDKEKVADSGSKERVVTPPPAPEPSSMTLTPAPAPAPAPVFTDPVPAPAPAPKAAAKAPAPKPSAGTSAAAGQKTYVVQKGDNLTKISKKFYGDESHVKAIAAANNISDPNKIKAGQTLIIP